jgi:signal peptide peptidase SppA
MPQTLNASTMLTRMAQEPLLVAPGHEEMLASFITSMQADERFSQAHEDTASADAADDFWGDEDDEWMAWLRPYNVDEGVLTIPVYGVLIHKMSFKFGSWATGYEYIKRAFDRGMEDPEVHTIAFDHNSPGGMVAGNFELVEHVAAGRAEKRIVAFANDFAFSASYNLAAAAEEIVLTRSGGVGSVGVVTMHVDYSGALKENGIKVTFIYAGKHKVEGNPYEKLPDAAKDRIQARIDRLYGEFVGLVAENRGMEEQAVRDTEALTYDASEAVEIGFADRIGTLDEEMAAMKAENRSVDMTTKPKAAASNTGGQFTQEDIDAAVATATETAKAEGHAEGVAAERARIDGIMGCEEAKTRPAAARMAISAGMDVEAAKAALAGMPEEKPAASTEEPKEEGTDQGQSKDAPLGSNPTPFGQSMEGTGVGASPQGSEGGSGNPDDQSNELLAALGTVTGESFGRKSA